MKIRKTDERDIDLLIQLRMDFLLDEPEPETLGDLEQFRQELRAYFQRGFASDTFAAFVAEDEYGAHSVAFLGITEKPPRSVGEPHCSGTVYNVYTDPDSRRRGYAKAVMTAIMEEAKTRNLKNVELLASRYGKPLYTQLGFTQPDHTYMRIRTGLNKQ